MARAKLMAFVGLNSSGFRRGMRAMKRRWRTFKATVVGPMARFGRVVGRTFMRAGLLIGAALVGAIKHANDFRNAMANVNTMLDGQDLAQFSDGILKMSGRFGMAKDTLAKGLFDILSAGIKAKDGMDFLTAATKAAIGGSTDTATAVDGLTTVMNAFGKRAQEVGHVSDVMFQIVKDGKITYAELAENIGKLAPTARAAGMSLEGMAAAVATIVKIEKPERAMTAIRAAMFKAAEGGETLFDLVKKFEGKSLEDIIGAGIQKRAAQGVAILANNMDILNNEIERFKSVGGRAQEAFEKMDKVRHWQKIWQSLLGIVTRVGTVLDKALAPAVNLLTNSLAKMADSPGFTSFLEKLKAAAELMVGVSTALAQGGKARELAIKGLKMAVVGMFQTAAMKAVDILLKVAPIIGKAIGEGAKSIFLSPLKKRAQRSVAIEQIERRKGSQIVFKNEIEAEVKKIQQIELDNAMRELAKQFETKLGPASNSLEAGMELLKAAAAAATSDLEEFKPKKIFERPGGPDRGVGDDVDDEKGEGLKTGFTELRRMGANIIGAGAAKDFAKQQRLRQIEEAKKMNAWLKKLDEKMGLMIGQDISDIDLTAKF